MKLLLIMPNFFNYPQIITDELNNMGYEVDFFDDRPSSNNFVKTIIRFNKELIQTYIGAYFKEIMKTVHIKKYNVVFLISGQSLSFSEDMIKEIKDCQSQAQFILYQWDSQKNFPYIRNMQKYFDKCYSFDKKDVDNSKILIFLPLFYCKMYEEIGKQTYKNFKFDFCFVGTAHPKKFKFIKMMSKQLSLIYPKQFIYFYLPSKIVFFYHKIKNLEFRKAKYNEIHFVSLKENEMKNLFSNSRCVLDSAQTGQIGLTIRVFEALGAKKKLIMTNKDVINYDFYKEENIYIYDGKIDTKALFFTQPYKDIDQEIYRKYSLKNWLDVILNGEVSNEY